MLTWVPGLCGAPDVPYTTEVTLNIAEDDIGDNFGGKSSLLKKKPPYTNLQEITKLSNENAVRLTFLWPTFENHNNKWDAILCRGNLYLHVPNGLALETSKQAFISLLEYAEELHCSNVVVWFPKNKAERSSLMRMFMFFGFVTLQPNHPLCLKDVADDMLFMAYNIE